MPTRPPHLCLTCGTLTSTRYCPPCTTTHHRAREQRRGNRYQRGYSYAYERVRKQVLTPGARCHWCGAPATVTDHLTPLSAGGSNDVEQRLASGRRLVPADFSTALRLEHQRANPDVTERVEVGPLTHEERQGGICGIALCRWVQHETRQGRPPSGPDIAAKQADPRLAAEHGRPGDEHRHPAQLLAGDTRAS